MFVTTPGKCLSTRAFLCPKHTRSLRLLAMASAENGNGVAGTAKGHEQASGIGQKVQDFAQKAVGAAGASVDKTVRQQTCTYCCSAS